MKRYNSPKNWPTPPVGWQPPPGWQPDPRWGPAPPNHQFWTDDYEETSPPRHYGKALTITALILSGAALLLCWVPVVNNVIFFLGLLAVVVAFVALVVTLRERSTFRAMAVAALVVGFLSVIGVVASQAYYSSLISGAFGLPGQDPRNAPSVITPQDTPSDRGTSPSEPPGETEAGTANRPFPLGTTAAMGKDYEVTVAAVKLDANAEVLGANQFNDPPEGQYVLAKINVKYVGDGEGNPWIDLSPTFVGTDARQYDTSSCRASIPDDAMRVPTLEKGGMASYQVCMDVPQAAIAGGKLFIEKRLTFNDRTRAYWALT